MSTKLNFYCVLRGESFDPTSLLSNSKIIVEDFNCHGDIQKKGRYKGSPYDYGYIRFGAKLDSLDDFLELLQTSGIKEILKMATTRELHLFLEYTKQCNWEFSLSEISKIYALELVLTISCDISE